MILGARVAGLPLAAAAATSQLACTTDSYEVLDCWILADLFLLGGYDLSFHDVSDPQQLLSVMYRD